MRFTLDPDGAVREARVQQGSGSGWLDDATLSMLQSAHLPAPPADMPAALRTVTVGIRYRLAP